MDNKNVRSILLQSIADTEKELAKLKRMLSIFDGVEDAPSSGSDKSNPASVPDQVAPKAPISHKAGNINLEDNTFRELVIHLAKNIFDGADITTKQVVTKIETMGLKKTVSRKVKVKYVSGILSKGVDFELVGKTGKDGLYRLKNKS